MDLIMHNQPFQTDTIEHLGVSIRIEYYPDWDHDAPWIECEGHGAIRHCVKIYGRPDKSPGEVLIHCDRGDNWFYDVAHSTRIARRDEWGISTDTTGMTKGQIAAAAVATDMAFCRGFLRDDWGYVGIVCTVLDDAGKPTEHDVVLCGFESYNDYHLSAGADMAKELAEQTAYELLEREYWNARDVVTHA